MRHPISFGAVTLLHDQLARIVEAPDFHTHPALNDDYRDLLQVCLEVVDELCGRMVFDATVIISDR